MSKERGYMAGLLSVNVGRPRDIEWQGRTVHTGVWKCSVEGRRRVGRLNIDGDGQGDLAGHGGEQRAVLVYQGDSYRHWGKEVGRDRVEDGAVGEKPPLDGAGGDEGGIGGPVRHGTPGVRGTPPRGARFPR